MPSPTLILDHVYNHETTVPDRAYLSQPVGAGKVIDYTWSHVLEQARRMAAHLRQGRCWRESHQCDGRPAQNGAADLEELPP